MLDFVNENIYNKSNLWQALGKKPAILSFVCYALDHNNQVVSRLCQSAVIVISGHKQDTLNNREIKQDVSMSNINGMKSLIDCTQFYTEKEIQDDFIARCKKKHISKDEKWLDKWQMALQQIIEWDSTYQRPKDNAAMSERERQQICMKFGNGIYL